MIVNPTPSHTFNMMPLTQASLEIKTTSENPSPSLLSELSKEPAPEANLSAPDFKEAVAQRYLSDVESDSSIVIQFSSNQEYEEFLKTIPNLTDSEEEDVRYTEAYNSTEDSPPPVGRKRFPRVNYYEKSSPERKRRKRKPTNLGVKTDASATKPPASRGRKPKKRVNAATGSKLLGSKPVNEDHEPGPSSRNLVPGNVSCLRDTVASVKVEGWVD